MGDLQTYGRDEMAKMVKTATDVQILERALIIARLLYDRWQGTIHFNITEAETLAGYASTLYEEYQNRCKSQTEVDQTTMKVVDLMRTLVHGGIIPDLAEIKNILNAGRDLFEAVAGRPPRIVIQKSVAQNNI